jgi:bifunctional DNA-binding transcriptional regulator/antitoxin component of YhaV-PrlF toxin-antitoxin module
MLSEEELDELYFTANMRRWGMGRSLLERSPDCVLVPLYPYCYKDKTKCGKVPCILWNHRTQTTLRDLQDWQGKYDGFCNLGLVLGIKSGGILAIDVDGEEGRVILKNLSRGDLPPTVAYSTPGGDGKGERYLYRYPPEYQGKILKKYSKTGKGEHSELAILAEGQQTVLPYSIHPNGGIYKFFKERSFMISKSP